jgi:hypothetical protein
LGRSAHLTSLQGVSRYWLNQAAAASPSSTAVPLQCQTVTVLQGSQQDALLVSQRVPRWVTCQRCGKEVVQASSATVYAACRARKNPKSADECNVSVIHATAVSQQPVNCCCSRPTPHSHDVLVAWHHSTLQAWPRTSC